MEEFFKKFREYYKKRKGVKLVKFGEFKGVSFEDEFDEVWGIEEWGCLLILIFLFI